MRTSSVVFTISPESYITVYLKCALENVLPFDTHGAMVRLHHGALKDFLISAPFYSFDADLFKDILQEILQGDLEVPLGVSIGRAWEEYKKTDAHEKNGDSSIIGPLWSVGGSKGSATFLYTQQGKIFLETFPYWNREGSYEEFLAKLQSVVRIELPRATVEAWLKQTEELLKIIKGNCKRALRKDIRRYQKKTAANGRCINQKERMIRLISRPSLKRFLSAAKKKRPL